MRQNHQLVLVSLIILFHLPAYSQSKSNFSISPRDSGKNVSLTQSGPAFTGVTKSSASNLAGKKMLNTACAVTLMGAVAYVTGEVLLQRQYRTRGDLTTSSTVRTVGAIVVTADAFVTVAALLTYPPPKHKQKIKAANP